MNDVPPRQDRPDDVDENYRRASALDPSRPNEETRRAVLAHAARVAAERGAEQSAQRQVEGHGARKGAPRRGWRRPAVFGTLAAAVLAGLVIVPRIDSLRGPATESPLVAPMDREQKSSPAAAPAPSPGAAGTLNEVVVAGPPPARQRDFSAKTNTDKRVVAPDNSAGRSDVSSPPDAPARQSGARSSADSVSAVQSASAPAAAQLQQSAGTDNVQITGHRIESTGQQRAIAARLVNAAQAGDLTTVQSMLDQNAFVDARDPQGRTALMLAVQSGHIDLVNVLLSRGADPNAEDLQGVTPLQAATAAAEATTAAVGAAAGSLDTETLGSTAGRSAALAAAPPTADAQAKDTTAASATRAANAAAIVAALKSKGAR